MRMTIAAILAGVCVAGLAVTGLAADQIDNPQYQSWAKYKPGMTVVHKMTNETKMAQMPGGGMTMESTTTRVLKEVKPESVTVEMTTKTTMNGMDQSTPATTTVIPAKIDKGQEDVQVPSNMKAEIKDMKTGKDTVEISGKKYETATREYTMVVTSPMAMTSQVKTWTSSDVPGSMVKMENKTSTPMETNMTVTLVSFEQK
jgi:hypothetical protein